MVKNKSYSSYWLGSYVDDGSIDLASKGITTSEIIRLASIKNAISNFVQIVTKRTIAVKFNSGVDSYTDGNTVIISATTKEKTFDAVVGLALHEATHCVWKEFPDFLKQFSLSSHLMIPQSLVDKCADVNITTESRGKLAPSALAMMLKNLMNTFEDRRIDWWLYRTAPGYRPYYEALYSQYWHSKQIDYALQQGKWNVPLVENYLNLLINMTNPWFDTRALPELDRIYGMIDVNHINRFDNDSGYRYVNNKINQSGSEFDLDKMPHIFQLAVRVMDVILANCLPVPDSDASSTQPQPSQDGKKEDPTKEDNLDLNQGMGFGPGGSDKSDDDSDGDSDDDKNSDKSDDASSDKNSDSGESKNDDCKDKHAAKSPKKDGKISDKRLEKALEKQRGFLDGNVQKKRVTKKVDTQVRAIEQSGASEVDVPHSSEYGEHTTKVLVLRKFTREILESGAFPFTSGISRDLSGARGNNILKMAGSTWKPMTDAYSVKAIEEGFRMGNILAHRLQIRNMTQITRFNRRDRGNIERRRLHALGAGDTAVFFKDKITKFSPVLAHMTLDASSSMAGEKWTRALSVGIAVAVAASKINNLDFVLSMRAGVGLPCIAIIYDSRVDKPMKIKQLFPYLSAVGNTPEGLCFAAIMDDLLKEQHGERFFINLSDGEPWYYGYNGEPAWKHTREQVNILRGSGLKILSYFISYSSGMFGDSGGKEGFKVMYGKDAQFIDVQRITTLARTLNRLFLIR